MSFNDVDDKDFLTGLFNAIYDELPTQKSKKKKFHRRNKNEQ